MGKIDDEKHAFLPIFLANVTARQRKDYELAKVHFGPSYRVEDTNYFAKKFKEYQGNPSVFKTIADPIPNSTVSSSNPPMPINSSMPINPLPEKPN